MLEDEPTSQCGRIATKSGRNGNETVAKKAEKSAKFDVSDTAPEGNTVIAFNYSSVHSETLLNAGFRPHRNCPLSHTTQCRSVG